MSKILRFILPVAILAICVLVGIALIWSSPKAERRQPPPIVPTVEIMVAQLSGYPVVIRSQGTVMPRTESTLIPEVSGQVVKVSANFQTGGFFEAGEVLLEIDPRNYQNSVVVAQADHASANATLDEEKARSDQAFRDWQVLNLSSEPNALALRKPQLKSAQAAVAAATARLAQARIDLARTQIRAPYAGMVLDKRVDIGQYVSPGNVLAKIYAIDFVEIRLPLTNNQLALLDLPESYRGEAGAAQQQPLPAVDLIARSERQLHHWLGRIVRTEGSIDTQSQQIFVIAQVDDPYSRRHGAPLKIGQFVEAHINGRVFNDVFVLPRSVLRGNNEVVVIDDNNKVERRQVEVIWNDNDQIVVSAGLTNGDRVSLTPLPYAVSGTRVQISPIQPAIEGASG